MMATLPRGEPDPALPGRSPARPPRSHIKIIYISKKSYIHIYIYIYTHYKQEIICINIIHINKKQYIHSLALALPTENTNT